MPLARLASPLARVAARRALGTVAPRRLSSHASMPAACAQPQEAGMELDAMQIAGLLEMLDARRAAPQFAGVKWQQDGFGVWTMVPWSDTTEFSAEVTRPGHVTRNGMNYMWHEHPAKTSDPFAVPHGVWVATE